MNMRTRLLAAILVGSTFCISKKVMAQDTNTDSHTITITVPAVSLLDLETADSKNFSAAFVAPTEAGNPITAPANNATLWLNYSAIQTGTTTKKVAVKASAVLAGLDISLVAAAPAGGAGTLGTPASSITLTAVDQTLISGIGSGYTDTGTSKGCLLTYHFAANTTNYGLIRSGTAAAITVTYTLSDDI